MLLVENGESRLRDVWRINLEAPLGTSTRDVIPDGDLSRASQGQLARLRDPSYSTMSPYSLSAYAAALNPAIQPDRLRWVLGRDPLRIAIGVEKPPLSPPAARQVSWASLVRERDTGRYVDAVLDYGSVGPPGADGPRARDRRTAPGSLTLYRLKEPITLGMLCEMLDAYGVAFLRREASAVTRPAVVLDEGRL